MSQHSDLIVEFRLNGRSGGIRLPGHFDGMARRLCTFLAIGRLKRDGFLVLDNSNRADYDLAFQLLAKAGFRQLPFWGLVPGADFLTCTSFFTRSMERLPTAYFVGNSFGLPEY